MAKRVLILDTPGGQLHPLEEAFERSREITCDVDRVFERDRLLEKLDEPLEWDLVVLDYVFGDGAVTGETLVESIRRDHPELPIIAVAEQADVALARQAVRAGATDLLVRSGELADRVETLLEKIRPHLALLRRTRALEEQNRLLAQPPGAGGLIGESPQIRAVIAQARRAAAIPRPVLIVGERGTGKELLARIIHDADEPAKPMVTVNCAAFVDTLLESELFGHEKGAFTGADTRGVGKFELADRGTLFLDEIGHMSLPFQQKILRVVEYGTFSPVGSTEEIRTSARIVAATNTDLQAAMNEGRFLRDLYDRLSFDVLRIPPLRERAGDVELLARHFLRQFMREIPSLSGKVLGAEAIELLNGYPFPGNVRELKNIIERAAYRDTTNEITGEDIGLLPPAVPCDDESAGTFEERAAAYERRLLADALAAAKGNQAQAARALGLPYHRLRYLLRKHDLREE